ncbi:Hypothetical protein UVM_LOCUS467 [uncultured virus]|nr:Hypothetical protein UVM_LOCUS467 [uncultured virus]
MSSVPKSHLEQERADDKDKDDDDAERSDVRKHGLRLYAADELDVRVNDVVVVGGCSSWLQRGSGYAVAEVRVASLYCADPGDPPSKACLYIGACQPIFAGVLRDGCYVSQPQWSGCRCVCGGLKDKEHKRRCASPVLLALQDYAPLAVGTVVLFGSGSGSGPSVGTAHCVCGTDESGRYLFDADDGGDAFSVDPRTRCVLLVFQANKGMRSVGIAQPTRDICRCGYPLVL